MSVTEKNTLERIAEAKREPFGHFWCEFQSEQVIQKRELQLRGAVRKIERNTVRV